MLPPIIFLLSTYFYFEREIHSFLPSRKQLVAVSATYPETLKASLAKLMRDAQHIDLTIDTPVLTGYFPSPVLSISLSLCFPVSHFNCGCSIFHASSQLLQYSHIVTLILNKGRETTRERHTHTPHTHTHTPHTYTHTTQKERDRG